MDLDPEYKQKQMNDWYHAYSNDIYKFILYMIHDSEQAKDLMQDTFIRAFNNIDSFQGDNTKGWLFSIARNITIDFLRKKKPIYYLLDVAATMVSRELSPEQTLSLNEQERELYLALAKLKRTYREVIVLRKIKGFSVKETASILGCTEGKVKTNLWRAMNSLKRQLVKEGYDHESLERR